MMATACHQHNLIAMLNSHLEDQCTYCIYSNLQCLRLMELPAICHSDYKLYLTIIKHEGTSISSCSTPLSARLLSEMLTPGYCNEYCVSLTLWDKRSYKSTPLPPSVTLFTYFQALDTSSTLPADEVDGPAGDLLLAGISSACHLPGGGGPVLLAMATGVK